MKIVIGSDKSGFSAKEAIAAWLKEAGIEFDDLGTTDLSQVHPYYQVASEVAPLVQNGTYDKAILICGTGAGMSVVANKFKGVYAVAQGDGRGELRRVDGAAAADADHGVRTGFMGETGRLRNAGELGVLFHSAEHGGDAGVLLLHLFGGGGEVLAAGDDAALHAQLVQNLTELCKLPRAEEDLHRLGIDKLMRHRCSPRSR